MIRIEECRKYIFIILIFKYSSNQLFTNIILPYIDYFGVIILEYLKN